MGVGSYGIAGNRCVGVSVSVQVEPRAGTVVMFHIESQTENASSVDRIAVPYRRRSACLMVEASGTGRAASNASAVTENLIT